MREVELRARAALVRLLAAAGPEELAAITAELERLAEKIEGGVREKVNTGG